MTARAAAALLALAAAGAAPRITVKAPPLDFSGLWKLDEAASSGVSFHMRDAVLRLEQTGDRIQVTPVGRGEGLLAEQIVADGRPYEKTIGNGKGIVTAAWAKDRRSLWLEVAAGPAEDPRSAVQRSVWKLSDDRKTWVRQSVTIRAGVRTESRLVFRRRG